MRMAREAHVARTSSGRLERAHGFLLGAQCPDVDGLEHIVGPKAIQFDGMSNRGSDRNRIRNDKSLASADAPRHRHLADECATGGSEDVPREDQTGETDGSCKTPGGRPPGKANIPSRLRARLAGRPVAFPAFSATLTEQKLLHRHGPPPPSPVTP
jgi:hypothetical protein